MTKYIKATKTTELTNAGDYYEFYEGCDNLFHVHSVIEDGVKKFVDNIAFKTNKVINVGNTFLPNSLNVFDMSKIRETTEKYSVYKIIGQNHNSHLDGGNIDFVSKSHLAQILIEKRANSGVNLKELKQKHKIINLKNQNKHGYPLNSILVSFIYPENPKIKEKFVLIPVA